MHIWIPCGPWWPLGENGEELCVLRVYDVLSCIVCSWHLIWKWSVENVIWFSFVGAHLKTGGWIKFCFKMQLSHQILSLFHPAGRFLFCHPGREEVYFLDRLHIPRLGIFGEFEGKKKSYCQIERFHKILCTKCSVLCNTLSSLWSQNTRNVAYTFFNTLDGSSVQNSNGPTEKTLRCTSVFSSRYSPVTSFVEVKPKVDSVHST